MLLLLGSLAWSGELLVFEAAALGVATTPQKLSAELLEPGLGVGFRVGVGTASDQHPSVMEEGLHIDYTLGGMGEASLNQLSIGSVSSFPLEKRGWGLSLETDSAGGWAWMPGLPAGTEVSNGEDAHYGWSLSAGARVLTPSPVTVGYEHRWVSVEQPWRVGHQIVHGLAMAGVMLPALLPLAIGENRAQTPWPFTLGSMLVGFGGQLLFYTLVDYDRHNWPYDDEPPLRATQHVVSVGASF